MPKRFLNVEYAGARTEIDVTDFERLGQVQDAIKAKLTHALAHVDAPQLQLYDQQRQHIQDLEDVPEDYFQEEGPCLVIRTSPPPSRQASRNDLSESEGPRKRERTDVADLTNYLKAFANSQIVDNCIQSQELLPYPQDEIKNLFVRECYEDVFELLLAKVKSKQKSFAISGTPGIGKSLFFVYILHRLIKDTGKTLPLKPNRIVYQVGSSFKCFDLQQRTVTIATNIDADGLVREQDTFYIIDGRNSEPLLSSCVTLFISSLRSEWCKEFVKQRMAYEWCFPVWTWEELETCQQFCYPNLTTATLNERYRIYGGVARYVFHRDQAIPVLKKISAALSDVNAVRGVRYVGQTTDIFPESHTLMHILVGDDEYGNAYQFTDLDVASRYVGEQLWQRHAAQMMTNLQDMFGGGPNEISRHLFEIYGHRVFSAGGRTLQCRNLDDNTLTELTLDSLDGKRVTFRKNALPATLEHGYYEPAYDDTFPAIDALTPQGMFQFTVADEHPIRGVQTLRQLCNLYDQPKLYFVVPPRRFAKFKKQRFLATEGQRSVGEIPGLKQYVLELPVISASAPSVQ